MLIRLNERVSARSYRVVSAHGEGGFEFAASADGERSADENAVTTLIAYSLNRAGVWLLLLDDVVLATARVGVGRLLVDQDALAADSMHGTQLSPEEREHWARLSADRHSFQEPTMWGVA